MILKVKGKRRAKSPRARRTKRMARLVKESPIDQYFLGRISVEAYLMTLCTDAKETVEARASRARVTQIIDRVSKLVADTRGSPA